MFVQEIELTTSTGTRLKYSTELKDGFIKCDYIATVGRKVGIITGEKREHIDTLSYSYTSQYNPQ